jgi:hypothetical protein
MRTNFYFKLVKINLGIKILFFNQSILKCVVSHKCNNESIFTFNSHNLNVKFQKIP